MRKREKAARQKGKRERGLNQVFSWICLEIHTARTHDMKRNDFPVGLTPQPPISFFGPFGIRANFRISSYYGGPFLSSQCSSYMPFPMQILSEVWGAGDPTRKLISVSVRACVRAVVVRWESAENVVRAISLFPFILGSFPFSLFGGGRFPFPSPSPNLLSSFSWLYRYK